LTQDALPPPPTVPPQLEYFAPSAGSRRLHDIARYQRNINACVVGAIAVSPLLAEVNHESPMLNWVAIVVVMSTIVTAALCLFRLAMALYDNKGTGITLGILALIPIFGLLILVIVMGKATRVLRSNGIPVGLMGAKHVPPAGDIESPR